MSLDDRVGSPPTGAFGVRPSRRSNHGAAPPNGSGGSAVRGLSSSKMERARPGLQGARCVICGSPTTPSSADPVPVRASPWNGTLPEQLPPVQLCDEHRSQYDTDWLLLGWCV